MSSFVWIQKSCVFLEFKAHSDKRTLARMPPKRPPQQVARPSKPQGRYFAGKGQTAEQSSSDEEDEQEQDGPLGNSQTKQVVKQAPVKVDLQHVEVLNGRVGGASAIAEIQHKASRPEAESEDESDESDDESDSSVDRSLALKAAKIRAAKQAGQAVDLEESSSEYDSESDDGERPKVLYKPVFIPKHQRDTVQRQPDELDEEEAEKQRKAEIEQRNKESRQLVGETVRREMAEKEAEENNDPEVDDTDGLDPEGEYQAWKLRELNRIKRDKEERIAREKELDEIERRRNLPEEERLKEDLERAKQLREEKPKGSQKFLQKYFHKGAFYADQDILRRDYTEATSNEVRHKELLPEVMQVRDFGKRSRTKWTHLANEDTTSTDAGWAQKSSVNKRSLQKMGGIHEAGNDRGKRRRDDGDQSGRRRRDD